MKYLRYFIIVFLAYFLVMSLRNYAFLTVTFLTGEAYEGHDQAEIIARARLMMLPILAFVSLLFIGWLFPAKKLIVTSVLVICFPIFAYIVYSTIITLGFTAEQSLLAIIQGYGSSRVGLLLFYLLALIALPFANQMKKAEQGRDGDAEEAV